MCFYSIINGVLSQVLYYVYVYHQGCFSVELLDANSTGQLCRLCRCCYDKFLPSHDTIGGIGLTKLDHSSAEQCRYFAKWLEHRIFAHAVHAADGAHAMHENKYNTDKNMTITYVDIDTKLCFPFKITVKLNKAFEWIIHAYRCGPFIWASQLW